LFGPNQRVFNVTLNGAVFLTNFDIYVAAGNSQQGGGQGRTATARCQRPDQRRLQQHHQ